MEQDSKKTRFKSKSRVEKKQQYVKVVEPLAPESLALQLPSFVVTTDSVVATANLTFDSSHRHLEMHWGDDKVDVINLHRLRLLSQIEGSNQPLNSLTIQHVYEAPFDLGRQLVVAVTTDSDGKKAWDAEVIEVDPRYKLNFYSIVLEFPDHLDSFAEVNSEIDVALHVAQGNTIFYAQNWYESIATDPQFNIQDPIQWRLEGSHFSREISYSDGPIGVALYIDEHDGLGDPDSFLGGIWQLVSAPFRGLNSLFELMRAIGLPPYEFDGSAPLDQVRTIDGPHLIIHPSRPIYNRMEYDIGWAGLEGKIIANLSYELRLIVPLDNGLPKRMVAVQT